ncbi:MAG: Tim44 domain-containing protein [Gammaproteobacteria bacterium]|nr:Tim44 domain-containing protein [Gammaproteobacteria bacterium]
MYRIIKLSLITLLASTLLVTEAEARRFGGGKSFGYQRQGSSYATAPKQATTAKPAATAPAAPATGNRWLGPLAGLAAGGLLASMFMGHGFDGIKPLDILMILALAAAVFFVLRALRRPQPAAATGSMHYAGHYPGHAAPSAGGGAGSEATHDDTVVPRPQWFDEQGFIRDAKAHFIRLQAAHDRGDLRDIREYTTPEVFAEISLQLQERGTTPQQTEVVSVDARLLELVTEDDRVVASVRYTGQIREQADEPASAFDEIWHVQHARQRDGNWTIAGIQQTPLALAQ